MPACDMIITPQHWLLTARIEPISGGASMPVRRAVVCHYTEGATAQSSVDYWRERGDGVCAHVIIDRDGTIYQCRPFNLTAGHAGVSRWRDPTGKLYNGMNACSIGIELANAGNVASVARRFSKLPRIDAAHRNGGPVCQWEQFPQPQLVSLTYLVKALIARYNLDDITGHDCIAPERKLDPGPVFPMQQLRENCGFTGLPQVFKAGGK